MTDHRYLLTCSICGYRSSDDVGLLFCPSCDRNALLRTHYNESLHLKGDPACFASYAAWLPAERLALSNGTPGPRFACFNSQTLGEAMGLGNLWVLLSGNAPQYGASSRTGSFKETEVLGILSRLRGRTDRMLIVASAGNAGRAFLAYGGRMVVVVPEHGESLLRLHRPAAADSPLLVIVKNAYYPEAMRFVERALATFQQRLILDGGGYNVARRDAMGVPFLHAALTMGCLPDRYVQAVGSGMGAIAAWEASNRLQEHGLVAPHNMRLHLVQNTPFTPMVDAWQQGSRVLPSWSEEEVRERLSRMSAVVLSNSTPPYAVRGGIFDVLQSSGGTMEAVTNEEINDAQRLVSEVLEITPCAAASAAAAGVMRGVASGRIHASERVLLHLTGTVPQALAPGESEYSRRVRIDSTDEGLAAIERYLAE